MKIVWKKCSIRDTCKFNGHAIFEKKTQVSYAWHDINLENVVIFELMQKLIVCQFSYGQHIWCNICWYYLNFKSSLELAVQIVMSFGRCVIWECVFELLLFSLIRWLCALFVSKYLYPRAYDEFAWKCSTVLPWKYWRFFSKHK